MLYTAFKIHLHTNSAAYKKPRDDTDTLYRWAIHSEWERPTCVYTFFYRSRDTNLPRGGAQGLTAQDENDLKEGRIFRPISAHPRSWAVGLLSPVPLSAMVWQWQ